MNRHLALAAAVAPVALFLVVYGVLPTHGFMLDDYAWILQARVRSAADVFDLAREDNGFYRPAVTFSFAANELAFGLNPLGYGLTNVALALLCASGVFLMARGLNLSRGGAIAAALIWLLNVQGIRTAVLWLSGRTALILVLGSVCAAALLLRRRPVLALPFVALAMLAKEEALLLPVILTAWLLILRREVPPRRMLLFVIGAAVLVGCYFVVRSQTGAMTPFTAPPWYALSTTPARLFRHAQIYAGHIATFPLLVALGGLAILRPAKPMLPGDGPRLLGMLTIWVVGTMALTILVPIRSDLYAVLPSVAAAILAAHLVARAWSQANDMRRRRALLSVVIASVVLSPVYYQRTQRRSANVRTASALLAQLRPFTAEAPARAIVTIEDDEHRSLSDTFGPHLGTAHELFFGQTLDLRLLPHGEAGPGGTALRLAWVNGRLEPRGGP